MDPHITVLAPDKNLADPTQAAKVFSNIRLSTSPFAVSAYMVAQFTRRHTTTIVLRAEPDAQFQNLFRELVGKSTWQETVSSIKRPFIPHITLANQLPDTLVPSALGLITEAQPSIAFTCTSVALYAKKASWDAWMGLATLALTALEKQHLN